MSRTVQFLLCLCWYCYWVLSTTVAVTGHQHWQPLATGTGRPMDSRRTDRGSLGRTPARHGGARRGPIVNGTLDVRLDRGVPALLPRSSPQGWLDLEHLTCLGRCGSQPGSPNRRHGNRTLVHAAEATSLPFRLRIETLDIAAQARAHDTPWSADRATAAGWRLRRRDS